MPPEKERDTATLRIRYMGSSGIRRLPTPPPDGVRYSPRDEASTSSTGDPSTNHRMNPPAPSSYSNRSVVSPASSAVPGSCRPWPVEWAVAGMGK